MGTFFSHSVSNFLCFTFRPQLYRPGSAGVGRSVVTYAMRLSVLFSGAGLLAPDVRVPVLLLSVLPRRVPLPQPRALPVLVLPPAPDLPHPSAGVHPVLVLHPGNLSLRVPQPQLPIRSSLHPRYHPGYFE